jgi:MFS family permease
VTAVAPSRRLTVPVLGTTQTLAWASSYYLPAVLAPAIAADTAVPTTWVFGAFSLALIVVAAIAPAVGKAIDKRGGRVVLIASNLIFAGGLGLLSIAHDAIGLGAAWLVLGLAMACGLYDAAFATLAGIYGRDARGPITGITLMAGFASTIGWPVSTFLMHALGWREACLIWAIIHLIVALPLNIWLLPKHRTQSRRSPVLVPQTEPGVSGQAHLMILLGGFFAIVAFVSTAMAAHLPRLLVIAGATPVAAVAAAALVGPAQVGARLVEFGLLRRLNPVVSACIAVSLHPIGAVLILALGAPAAVAFALLHGAGNGMLTIAKGTLPLALFGPEGYGLRTGRLSRASSIAQAVAPLGFGMAVDGHGMAALWGSASLGLAGLLLLIGIFRLRHTKAENDSDGRLSALIRLSSTDRS